MKVWDTAYGGSAVVSAGAVAAAMRATPAAAAQGTLTAAAVEPLLAPALAWIRANYGVVIGPRMVRVEISSVPPDGVVAVPVAQAWGINNITDAKGEVVAGAALIGPYVKLPTPAAVPLTVELLAGVQQPVPHLLLLAVAAIVSYWIANPAGVASGVVGDEARIGQYLAVLGARKGVCQWQ